MSIFNGKTAFVTGAATGIGRATALDFARKGASVVVADINGDEAKHTVDLINDEKGQAVFLYTEISDEKNVQSSIAETINIFGRLDFACNNAGIEGASAPVGEMKSSDSQRVIDVNLTGVFLSMKYEIPEMLKAGGGAIVNMASILGQVGFANAAAYTAAKHGVLGLTKVAALEYSARGIRVNAVCPAFIDTPMLQRAGITSDPAVKTAMEAMHPIGRLGQADEIAKVVTWLCSSDASFIAGESVLVDGAYAAK